MQKYWTIKICYQKNRKVAAVEQKAANMSYYCQKLFYRDANAGKKIDYDMD